MKGNSMETNQIQEDVIEIDLKELFFVLYHKAWLLILVLVVCAGGAGIFTKTMIPPQYESSSMLYILSQSTSITTLADIQLGSQLTKDYQVLVKSRPVLEEVISNLNLDLSYEEILEKTTITNATDTRIISIKVLDVDPKMAKIIADEIATVSAVRIAEIMKTEEPSIVEEGHIATNKSSPSTSKNCMIAGFLGFCVTALILVVRYLMNDSIRSADDIEKYLNLTTLGVIPIEGGKKGKNSPKGRRRKNEDNTK